MHNKQKFSKIRKVMLTTVTNTSPKSVLRQRFPESVLRQRFPESVQPLSPAPSPPLPSAAPRSPVERRLLFLPSPAPPPSLCHLDCPATPVGNRRRRRRRRRRLQAEFVQKTEQLHGLIENDVIRFYGNQ